MEINEGNLPDSSNSINRKKNKRRRLKKRKKTLTLPNLPLNNHPMASWTDTYTRLTNWHHKHEVSYWKAKAKALECENKVLHDIIRSHHMLGSSTSNNHADISEGNSSDSEAEDTQDPASVEVSEEFMEFIKTNARIREEAKREKERLRGECGYDSPSDLTKKMEAPPVKKEDDFEEHKKLYGKDWQRIAALETSLHSQFMVNYDKYKPLYWPQLPLNL